MSGRSTVAHDNSFLKCVHSGDSCNTTQLLQYLLSVSRTCAKFWCRKIQHLWTASEKRSPNTTKSWFIRKQNIRDDAHFVRDVVDVLLVVDGDLFAERGQHRDERRRVGRRPHEAQRHHQVLARPVLHPQPTLKSQNAGECKLGKDVDITKVVSSSKTNKLQVLVFEEKKHVSWHKLPLQIFVSFLTLLSNSDNSFYSRS